MLGHIDFESDISVVRGVELHSVDIDVPIVHKAVKIKDYLLILPLCRDGKGFAIPAFAHRLEASCSACGLVPGELKLEVVRQIDPLPGSSIAAVVYTSPVFPSEIEQLSFDCSFRGLQ